MRIKTLNNKDRNFTRGVRTKSKREVGEKLAVYPMRLDEDDAGEDQMDSGEDLSGGRADAKLAEKTASFGADACWNIGRRR